MSTVWRRTRSVMPCGGGLSTVMPTCSSPKAPRARSRAAMRAGSVGVGRAERSSARRSSMLRSLTLAASRFC